MTRRQRTLHVWIWIVAALAMAIVGARALEARHRTDHALIHAAPGGAN